MRRALTVMDHAHRLWRAANLRSHLQGERDESAYLRDSADNWEQREYHQRRWEMFDRALARALRVERRWKRSYARS